MSQDQSLRRTAASIALALWAVPLAAQPGTGSHFALPSQDLSTSLRQVAAQTGTSILAPDALLRGHSAPALEGNYDFEQVLTALLAGSGLTFRRVDGAFVIVAVGTGTAADVASSRELVVTGSHVRSAAPTASVITITRHDIEQAAPASVEELMRKLPQNLSAGVADENFAVTGAGSDITDHGAGINLRGLGQRATLVLVDGRRVAPSGTGSFVDVSMIPVSAIERIEILTDGASAIYGSDAVAGVVNIILRDDFRGLETMAQAGTSTRGGGDQELASATAGGDWSTGRAMLSYEYLHEGEIGAGERGFTIKLPSDWSLFPSEQRQSLFGSARQELAPGLSVELSGSFAHRRTRRSYFVAGPLIPVDGDARATSIGGTAALQWEVAGGWRAEFSASAFRSKTAELQLQPQGSGLVNRFDTENSTRELGIKADGPLLALPGGEARLAAGATIRRESYSSLFETQVNPPTPQAGSRTVRSLYGELYLPLFGDANRRPGLERLTISAAARLERYDRLGSTTNPKVGLSWSPVPGLSLRTSYGTSFRAPLLSESLGLYNAYLFPAALLYLDPSQAPAGVAAALIGSNPAVKPEHSRSITAGATWSPSSVPNLSIEASYYRIRFSNRITIPTDQIVVVGDPALDPIVTHNPSLPLITGLLAGAGQVLDVSGPGFTNGGATPADVVVIVDARASNTAETRTSGLDITARYKLEIGRAQLGFTLNANHVFNFDDRLTATSPVIHTLDTPYHPVSWRARGGVSGADGPFSAFAFVNFTGGYWDRRATVPIRIRSWTTLDGGLAYTSMAPSGLLHGVRLAANVQNILDTDPPRLLPDPGSTEGIGYDPTNATGRGRVIAVQLSKKW